MLKHFFFWDHWRAIKNQLFFNILLNPELSIHIFQLPKQSRLQRAISQFLLRIQPTSAACLNQQLFEALHSHKVMVIIFLSKWSLSKLEKLTVKWTTHLACAFPLGQILPVLISALVDTGPSNLRIVTLKIYLAFVKYWQGPLHWIKHRRQRASLFHWA